MKKFAFLVHPRDISDMVRPLPWLKYVPSRIIEEVIGRLSGRYGFIVWSKFDVYGRTEGYVVIVSLAGQQMLSLPRRFVQDRILDAVLYAQEKLDVGLVGLGAYTAPLTDSGKWLAKQDSVRINITHGDSYSVAIAEEGICKIVSGFGLKMEQLEVSIVGAYGLIGRALAKILRPKCKSLLLIGRNETKLEKLKKELGNGENLFISLDISDVVRSDFVVTATSFPGALIEPHYLKKKAIVYDIAQPINVSKRICEERPDIVRIDGCYAKIPGVDLKVDMGPPEGATFSCLAETIMQALEDDDEDHVGEIELAHVERTGKWGKKYGFEHAEFTNFGEKISF